MKNSWYGIENELSIELYEKEGKIYSCDDDKLIPQINLSMVPNIGKESYELEIHFESSGYSDSGRTYGRPEDCYPPEYEDERTFKNAYLTWHPDQDTKQAIPSMEQGKTVELDKSIGESLFDLFENEIGEVEFESSYEDGWWHF